VLKAKGYVVRDAPNGRAALEILTDFPVDLVVTDYMMPAMDGIGLLEAIRAEKAWGAIPVLLLSALDEGHIRGLSKHVGPVLQKPFQLATLLGVVGSLLTRHRRDARCSPDHRPSIAQMQPR
jgi:DNA-binding response OmpR family regulator